MAEDALEGIANGIAQSLVLAVLNSGDETNVRRYIEMVRNHALAYEHHSQRVMFMIAGRCEQYLNRWTKNDPPANDG